MSKVENVNFCCICDLAFETRKQFVKHNLSDEHLNRARKEYEDEVEDLQSGFSDETSERMYNPDKDEYILKPKDLRSSFANNTKDIIETKTETETKAKKKQILMIISTPELSLNVKNVTKNLEEK